MQIDIIIEEASNIGEKYNLQFIEIDRTDNTISLILLIDNDLFIQIYGNTKKDKLNLALIFKERRLYGYDSEGGEYHYHPFDDPDKHIFIENVVSINDFVQESIKFLEENNIL